MKFILKEYLGSIRYDFGTDGYSDYFEYEPDEFSQGLFVQELMKTYSKETLEEIFKDQLPEDYDSLSVEEQLGELKDLVSFNLEEFSDDAYDYFYDDAEKVFADSESYRKDPYAYNGVSPRDFF